MPCGEKRGFPRGPPSGRLGPDPDAPARSRSSDSRRRRDQPVPRSRLTVPQVKPAHRHPRSSSGAPAPPQRSFQPMPTPRRRPAGKSGNFRSTIPSEGGSRSGRAGAQRLVGVSAPPAPVPHCKKFTVPQVKPAHRRPRPSSGAPAPPQQSFQPPVPMPLRRPPAKMGISTRPASGRGGLIRTRRSGMRS